MLINEHMETGQPSPPSLSKNAGSPADESSAVQKLSLLYTENAKVAATFWEWRHKVMERFFAGLAAIIVASAWLYQRGELRRLLFIPLLIGAAFCVISYFMDRVNKRILLGCYATGKEIEEKLGSAGAYTRISVQYKRVNYSYFLRMLYLGTAALLLTMSLLAARFVR